MTSSGPGRFFSAVVAAAVVVALSVTGYAQSDSEIYQATVERGYKYFDSENYAAARAEFEKAYQIQPKPLLLFNIASTYRREGNDKVALAYYTKFLDVAAKDHPQRRQTEEVIDFLKQKIKSETGNPASDGAEGDGSNVVTTSSEGHDPAKPGTTLIWSGIGAGALGVVGIGYAIFEAQRARDRNDQLEALAPGSAWSDENIALFEQGEAAEKRAIVFSILGTAAVATGTALFVIGMQKRKRGSSEREVAVTPYAAGDEAGVALTGSF